MTDDLAKEILEHIRHLDTKLSGHIRDENAEIKAQSDKVDSIREDLHAWRIAAEKRHGDLMLSLDSWTTKMDLSAAFLRDENGKLLLVEHYDEHLTSKQFKQWTKDLKIDVAKQAIKVVLLGFLTWAGYLLWEGFLRGPHK